MSHRSPSLLRQRRFFPYFMTQFWGAFNDNFFKTVILLLVAFSQRDQLPFSSHLFINLAAGLFILPFFLFSSSAGVLADKYEKSALIRFIKVGEVIIMCLGALALIYESYLMLLMLLFLMGVQSAFFGPVKYALLPQHLKVDELISGNALVETGTFLAILLGTVSAGMIASFENLNYIAATAIVLFSILGYFSSRYIPKAEACAPDLVFRWQPIQQTKKTLSIVKDDPLIFVSVIAISWFWFVGSTYLTQFPTFTKLNLHATEGAVSFLLALFSIGIALGSTLCDKLSDHHIDVGFVPMGGLGISIFGYLMITAIPESLPTFTHFNQFIQYTSLWPLFIYLLLIGLFGGLFIVPLYALIQQRAKAEQCSQTIAALNIYNALFMVSSAIFGIMCLSWLDLSIPSLFLILAGLNLLMAGYLLFKFPVDVLRTLNRFLIHLFYRISYKNLHLLPKQGGALIVCNHVSFVDAFVLMSSCRRPIRFVMEEDYAYFPIVRYILKKAQVIPISAQKTQSIRHAFNQVEDALNDGHIVCIFPEGKLTSDGEISEFMRGISLILKRSPVPVIPMALKGLWGSYFSRIKGRACYGLPKRFRTRLEVEVGEAVPAKLATTELMREKVAQLRGDWR